MLKVISPHYPLPPHSSHCRPRGARAGFSAAALPKGCAEDRGDAVLPLWGHCDNPAKSHLFYHGEKWDEEWFPKTQASRFCQAA